MQTLFKQQRSRRKNGRFATAKEAHYDKIENENIRFRFENEMLLRKSQVFTNGVLKREITIC